MSVHVVATGGTISSHHDGQAWRNLTGAELIAELGDAVPPGTVVRDVAAGPSSNLTVHDMLAIAGHVREALAAGADGVVVVHGTDTIELTSFVTQLVLGNAPGRRPVVFTGSMRVHSHPAPDGPGNLRDALALAASPAAVGHDVLVCLDGTVHSARAVHKVSAASLDAFSSAPFAPAGSVRDGEVLLASPPSERPAATAFAHEVALVTAYPGVGVDVLEHALRAVRGVVVEGFGDLNVPQQWWGPIHGAWNDGCLVAVASRPFTPTLRDDGLAMLGAVGAGGLTAQKARLALMAALGSTTSRDDAIAFLEQHALAYDAGERSTGT